MGAIEVKETYRYQNGAGRPSRRETAVASTPQFAGASFALDQTWTDLGLPASISYPTTPSLPTAPARVIWNAYTAGRLTGVEGYAAITYQPTGLVGQITHGASGVTETWQADPNGMPRPRRIEVAGPSGPLWSYGNYAFDGAGNITAIGNRSFAYDAMSRIIGWTDTSSARYTTLTRNYDSFGNFTSSEWSSCSSVAPGDCLRSRLKPFTVVGATNHYAHQTYDDAGNVTTDSMTGQSYAYDAAGMMISVTGRGRNDRYLYTADDERIALVDLSAGTTTWTVRGTDQRLLRTFTRTSIAGNTGWSWTEDDIWRGSQILASESPTGRKQYHLDHLGTPRLITNASGQLLGEQKFEPFGSGASADSGRIAFTGHELDRAPNNIGAQSLIYAHARFLSPDWGRFLSVDPKRSIAKAMLSPQRWNRYAYASNNPLKYIDPDGQEQVTFGDKRTEMLFRQLEARHAKVAATLNRYRGAGTPDLHIQRGNAGVDIDGKTAAKGVLNARIAPSYDVDKIVATGAKQDDSSLLPATGKFLSGSKLEGATLTLSDGLTQGSKAEKSVALHELGHAESAATNPDRYLALGADDVVKPNGKLVPHDDRPLEKEADAYRDSIQPPL